MTTASSMPCDIREVFQHLYDEIVWIHVKWQMYRQVYGTDELRIGLLNDFAPVFFRICQDALFDDVLISINRLIDPPEMSGRENLSLKRLVDMVDPKQHEQLATELQQHLVETERKCRCKAFQSARNRRIAHNDLVTIRGTSELIPGVSRQMVEEALESVRSLMNAASAHFDGTTSDFRLIPPEGIDGDVLIYNLERLQRYHQAYGDLPPMPGEHPTS